MMIARRLFSISAKVAAPNAANANEVIVSAVNGKRVITLNRPRALNALNLPMVRSLYPKFKKTKDIESFFGARVGRMGHGSDVRVVKEFDSKSNEVGEPYGSTTCMKWNEEGGVSLVIIKGAGDKAFCAGGDVVSVTKSYKANDPAQTVHKDFFREEYLLNHQIGVCKVPFIALIDGITMGGKWNEEGGVSLVIIKGAGDKAFCAGGDVVSVTKSYKANDPAQTVHKDFFREEYLLNHQIGVCKVPFIALIDGITMGGGCGLSVHGKFRVATERTMLAMPETALGLFPDVGGSYFLPRLSHYLGQFIALTGYRLNGADVCHSGIATHFVPSSSLVDLENELMKLPNSEVSNERVGEVISKFRPTTIPKFSLEPLLSKIESVFSANTVEEVVERLRKSDSDFARKQLAVLAKMSPTSMKITLRQLQEGAKMKFNEVFTMEYRLTQNIMKGHDFHEGCRAILIDKDRKPVWKPATLEEVTPQILDAYFAPLPPSDELIIR
ncbi:3-hydroxyisobutyryl-CoA hydrolase, mitochondrial [Toxocara canis]|uniref:3-hydroxyisobutyryl-CoA hydrolase, mitochondrial n=1 Tax=Toxocara canis TaxID=6265 RepID=A0A0B2VV04_TOXCA|nr:3-hydroxyisobutyryl-CoA hydrolase, mitochondrial [Toxocara canis]